MKTNNGDIWNELVMGRKPVKKKAPKPETKNRKLVRLERTVSDIETVTGFNRKSYIATLYGAETSIVDEVADWVKRANQAEAKNEELGKILERFVPPAKEDE